jgi:hypothetical protein
VSEPQRRCTHRRIRDHSTSRQQRVLTTTSTSRAWRTAAAMLLGFALVLSACGSDDAADEVTGEVTDETTDANTDDAADGVTDGAAHEVTDETSTASDEGTSSTDAPSEVGVVEVDLADFAFVGLPDSVPAGTRLTVTNSSRLELHKLSALPLADDEHRSVEELLALPGAELAAILRVVPATVLVAGPGGPQVDEIGDGTLNTPGRYLLICAVPVGLDPDEYLDALMGDGRRPHVSGGGAPHFRLGMVADLVVE